MANERMWTSDWAVFPGEILQEALEDRGLSQSELARRMGRPVKTVNEIVNGKAAITPDTALQLELALGISSSFWNRLEIAFREHQATARATEEWAGSADWAQEFPLNEMMRRKWIPKAKGPETVGAILAYFGVSSTRAWDSEWLRPAAEFRRQSRLRTSAHALSVWLREGERQAESMECNPFDEERFATTLKELRPLTRKAPAHAAIAKMVDQLSRVGVAVVLVEELPGAPVSGAASWPARNKALVQLSLRFKTDDQFWFSLFHECGHIHRNRGETFVDDFDDYGDSEVERDANEFARELLLPSDSYLPFVAKADFSAASVKEFARELEVAPGIVVGRLQHDELIPRTKLNSLKRRIEWA